MCAASTDKKYQNLIEYLKEFNSSAVACSGGVDSSFLLYAAAEANIAELYAVTVKDEIFPSGSFDDARKIADEAGAELIVVESDMIGFEKFRDNPLDRCYVCKFEMFKKIIEAASLKKISTVFEGSNADDRDDYRPGIRALKELRVQSPLAIASLTKNEIRQLAREMDLPFWNRPAGPCLATRIQYSDEITREKIKMVRLAEYFLAGEGIMDSRVRVHGNMARIETGKNDISRIKDSELSVRIVKNFKELGFKYVALDLEGYRMGSMNEVIPEAGLGHRDS